METMNKPVRVTAAEVAVGDRIAESRNREFQRVVGVDHNALSVWIVFEGGHRIRPRTDKKLWREQRYHRVDRDGGVVWVPEL